MNGRDLQRLLLVATERLAVLSHNLPFCAPTRRYAVGDSFNRKTHHINVVG